MPNKKIVSITLDEDVLAWVDRAAEGVEMSRSEFINFVLSGGKNAKDVFDKVIDNLFDQKKAELDQKKAEMKAKLRVPTRS